MYNELVIYNFLKSVLSRGPPFENMTMSMFSKQLLVKYWKISFDLKSVIARILYGVNKSVKNQIISKGYYSEQKMRWEST